MSAGGRGYGRPLERLVTWTLGPDVLRDSDVGHLGTVITDPLGWSSTKDIRT
jgi:hypothetical protein